VSDMPETVALEDVKAVIILTACDIAQKLSQMGDQSGAYALVTLVKTIEQMPIESRADIPATDAQAMANEKVQALVEALERISDLTSHNMGMSARDETCVHREARAALAALEVK